MKNNNTNAKNDKEMMQEEKLKYLEDKNFYLEAEIKYLKKLRAVGRINNQRQSKGCI